MKTGGTNKRSLGIALRTVLMFWLVMAATVFLVVISYVPMQKRFFRENLESKALGLAASLHNVVRGATVNEDFSRVVAYCKEMLNGNPTIEYFVITKSDGFSVVVDRAGWRSENNAAPFWRPARRQTVSGIGVVPPHNRRVFHFSQPGEYSGIEWGWIHVGLSLDGYDRSTTKIFQQAGTLAAACFPISLLAAVLYLRYVVLTPRLK